MENQEKYEVAEIDNTQEVVGFFDVAWFDHAQRVAKVFATSTMVPDHFKGNIGNCMIALNLASRLGADPFMLMQNMYIVHGRPGIEGKLVIALVNQSKRFTPLRFRFRGEGKTRECTAYATSIETGEVLEETVTWKMVEAEGWNKPKGEKKIISKWMTMPDLMFQYRSAAFFARVYCPEVLFGLQTIEELGDIVTLHQGRSGIYQEEVDDRPDPIKAKIEEARAKNVVDTGIEDLLSQKHDDIDQAPDEFVEIAMANTGLPKHPDNIEDAAKLFKEICRVADEG